MKVEDYDEIPLYCIVYLPHKQGYVAKYWNAKLDKESSQGYGYGKTAMEAFIDLQTVMIRMGERV